MSLYCILIQDIDRSYCVFGGGCCNLRLVRLKGLRQVHPDRPMAACFSTESYGITADLELDPESVQANQQT